MTDGGGKTASAKRVMKRLSQIKASLEAFPESFPRVDDDYLRLRGYRKAIVGDHILLYRISEYRAVIEDDEVVGEEPFLLINAVNLSLEEAFEEVLKRGGVCYPAHIDRSSNGIISMLGDFPPEPQFTAFEINDLNSLDSSIERFSIIEERGLVHVSSSDAHYLQDIFEKGFAIEIDDEPYSSDLVRNRLIDYLLGLAKESDKNG
jgi:hypothetical protein